MRRCRCLQKTCRICMEHLSLCQNSPRAPFTELSRNDQHAVHRAKKSLKQNTSYYTPPLKIYICLILKVSAFGPLLHSVFQSKSDSQQALRQEPLSTCLLTHISLGLFHNPCVSPFVICKWKKKLFHMLYFPCKDTLGVFAEIHSLVGRWKPPFCARASPSP